MLHMHARARARAHTRQKLKLRFVVFRELSPRRTEWEGEGEMSLTPRRSSKFLIRSPSLGDTTLGYDECPSIARQVTTTTTTVREERVLTSVYAVE